MEGLTIKKAKQLGCYLCGSISLLILKKKKHLGDSAPTERPVSPDKQHRAALLKHRFADTILRAQAKTFDQVGYMKFG